MPEYMKMITRSGAVLIMISGLSACSGVQSGSGVPGYVSDSMVEMALANAAGDACTGVSVNEAAVAAYKAEVELRLIGETGSSEAKNEVLKRTALDPKKYLEPKMTAFADRQGIELGDEQGFCGAIEREAKQNQKLASLLRS